MPAPGSKPRKRGDRWEIRWREPGGRRRSSTFETRREATAALRRLEEKAEERRREESEERANTAAGYEPPEPPPEPRTFAELIDYWLTWRAPEKRSAHHDESMIRAHLRPAFAHLRLDRIDAVTIDRFKAERGHLSKKTLHNVLTLLVTMLNCAVELEWLKAAPRVKKPRLPKGGYRYLRTKDEVRRFLDAAREEPEATIFPLFATAVLTGMRAGELAGLRWSDIDFDRRLITVQRTYDGKPTKSDEVRYVPILDEMLPILRDWRLRNRLEVVFPNAHGRPLGPSARAFQEVLKRVLERADFPPGYVRFHDLRHSFASHWMMAGGDLFKLQRILGHADVKMTQRYAHLAPDAFGGDLGLLGGLTPGESADVVNLR